MLIEKGKLNIFMFKLEARKDYVKFRNKLDEWCSVNKNCIIHHIYADHIDDKNILISTNYLETIENNNGTPIVILSAEKFGGRDDLRMLSLLMHANTIFVNDGDDYHLKKHRRLNLTDNEVVTLDQIFEEEDK